MKNSKKYFGFAVLFLLAINISIESCTETKKTDKEADKKQIASLLDSFNIAAAKADFNQYFNYYAEDAVFTGTDATERWNKKAFMDFARPYFDKGKAWNFTAINRHIYIDSTGNVAWFDELLNTQMKICRGSGVLTREGNNWKIRQYILSATVPNNIIDTVTALKSAEEDLIIRKWSGK
jgi:ketosteroid isomerase-like protein